VKPRPAPLQLHRPLLRWYRRRGRDLPWRRTRNPYAILVSEVMLQQTQVSRVLVKFPDFMALFPSIHRLAAAPQRDVVTAWQGMGYNNRAVRLHRLARLVVEHHGGAIPSTVSGLQSLPGIGRYSAHAVLAFAFRRPVPVVDVNVRRVLSRILWRMTGKSPLPSEEETWQAAGEYLPRRFAYEWDQALMDLGATVCMARAPRCSVCPVGPTCLSFGATGVSGRRNRRPEPSWNGIPNRIMRGRIVEALRTRPRGVPLHRLGSLIAENYRKSEVARLSRLVAALADDGLVRVSGRQPSTQRVSLA
jgi:A/G-specific adenine glycosylase